MNKEILNRIKTLTENDKKSLSQKALKVSEEAGELAKVVLPFENAHATRHRFVEKRQVLEEVVDTILAASSIAYDLKYSDEDIEEMMREKLNKWDELQHKDYEMGDEDIPYEIHITVNLENDDPYEFKELCREIGVKPIILDLENSGETVMKDVMTSSHHYGDLASVNEEVERIVYFLEKEFFKVERVKIESVPWHPSAPREGDENPEMPKDCYFEAHIGCIITKEQKGDLEVVADTHGAHLSRNRFKNLDNGKFVNMLTHRVYTGTKESFLAELELIKRDLDAIEIDYEKVITEFSIYDTNVNHDSKWLTKKEEHNG
jgi:NTP pyrophosphatase (non-canonical NTP hydrolase)